MSRFSKVSALSQSRSISKGKFFAMMILLWFNITQSKKLMISSKKIWITLFKIKNSKLKSRNKESNLLKIQKSLSLDLKAASHTKTKIIMVFLIKFKKLWWKIFKMIKKFNLNKKNWVAKEWLLVSFKKMMKPLMSGLDKSNSTIKSKLKIKLNKSFPWQMKSKISNISLVKQKTLNFPSITNIRYLKIKSSTNLMMSLNKTLQLKTSS